ncbi:Por secretion system C-terminal sorting domain-containing protein [Hyunsoonleella jejuensis]|uniref:Por secretion system C-terminal sorting domain-containing protein n=1 Tax=Hyunsoonleella jejuensis TaxID=419940 RepID=A0A1H9AHV7_9FLAO|nr:immunoglobulin-like domain-containing protein [Hyunsoonleella jejuensis]SEP76067.1 Por secretion system C-terminal sorting domain-containing protein [Hyunsoonleella jejuensis]
MKKIAFTLVVVFNVLFTFSQQNQSPKRISIANPSQNTLQKIQKAGIDLSCGPRFINNNLEMELGYEELQALKKNGISYQVLINNLTKYYSDRNTFDLPIAKNELRSLKKKPKKQFDGSTSTQKSLSLQNILVGNPTQHDECSEINWPVPSNFQLGSMGGCLTVSEALAQLDLMRSLYPNIISVKTDASPTGQTTHGNSTGSTTWPGQTVYYVRISDNPDIDEPSEPETLITGMTHSREVNSLMNVMYFMWYILENYNSDPFIKNVVDNQELYFIPIVNPDGLRWNEVIAPNGGGLQRKNLRPGVADNGSTGTSNNVRGVDLNRNFNYYWGWDDAGSSPTSSSNTYRGPSAGSEPETQILQDFVLNHDIKVAVNHHGGLNSIVTSSYNGSVSAADSGREDEYAKICHDLTHYNRYIYGSAPNTLYEANGDTNDWMLGGSPVSSGGQTSSGSGKDVLAFAPENGDDFWPAPSQITPIAQRALRMNFLSVLYSGKFAKLHDLNLSTISSTSGNLTFGVEYLGKTYDDITLSVTPVSSNITSISSPSTQSGWTKLEQRNLSVPYTLDPGILPNDEIEFQVTLSNNEFVLYQANYVKYYQANVLFSDNPDVTGTSNWTTSGGSWGTTSDAYSGSTAITDSPSGSYNNNENKSITLNSTIDLSGTSQVLVQYYAKWDLERNYDLVQIEASTNSGGSWTALCGNYNKPAAGFDTNFHLNKNTSTFRNHQSANGDIIYDGDTMDKWVMEEIYINATENTFLLGQNNVQFRFRLKSDSLNREDDLTTTFDGFIFDDFKIISIQTPCVLSVPAAVAINSIAEASAAISWDLIPSATYDLRYREVGSQNWTDVNGLSTPNYDITGLTNVTDYEVQVRSNCSTNSSAYSSVITFTTLDVQLNYCASASTNVNDEFISRVQLNTINNTSGAQFYSDFTNISTSLEKGTQYTITITPTWTGQVYTEAYSVWIDYNRDGDFEDAGEQVFTQSPTNASSVSGSFTVPASAVENSTRMRVSMQYNAIPTSCQTFQFGEVEDYTIIVEGAGPDVTPPVITLNGASPVSVTIGGTYSEEGATATDNIDGDISANIVVGGDTIDVNTLGSYTITYDVSDAAGNAATQVTRTVNVVEAVPGCSGGIAVFPYTQGFEGSIGDWSQSSADDLDWLVNSNNTPSNNTGPSGAVQGSSYIYVEASGNNTGYPNKRAIINSPCFDLSNATGADFSFQYHMFGAADMGTIDLEISNDDGASWISIWNQSGNQGNSWFVVNLDLSTYAGGSIQLRFNRFVGSTWQADIAIDDINLTTIEEDTIAPVITLIGASSIDLDVGGTYNEQGATATDNIDGDISASIVIGGDVVDTNIAGTYMVTYNVSDAAGNAATQVTRTVNVIPDTTAPVITLIGASSIDLDVGGTYNEQGATASDNIDGNISASIVIGGDVVDTNIAGTYVVTYNVSDAAGNAATQVTRTVNVIPDTTAPVITLIGASSIDLDVGGTYTEQGATATDNIDGDISASIVIGGDVVDTNIAGTFIVTYNVSDAAGNAATQVTRTVNVIPDTTAPVIALIGASSIDLNVGGTYTEQGATATDNIDGDISASIVIGGDVVDTNIAGTYMVTYNVSDAAGNAATQVARTINVNAIPTDVVLHQGFFETGLDGWTDGGSDCARRQDTRSYEGIYSVRIRDNSGTASAMTYSNVDITGFAEVQVNFYFYVVSMENNEDFWLRYYNGSSWTTIETWARGIDINNDTFYNATVVIPASVYNFASNSGFRFQCDASGNNDQIFIDQVTITGLSSASGSNNTLTNLGGTTKTGTDKYFDEEEEFIVYPNPVKGIELNVFVPGTDIFDFKIINMLGQIVAEGKSEGKIMVDRIESGVYIIEVNDGDELMTKRFIKE